MVEFNYDKIPLFKLIVHIAQIVLSVTIWILEIIVFKNGEINGQNGWTFAACWISVPAWIYLIMAPRYPRAANIAQPNALVTVDAIFTVIWLSAFATQAAYNTAGSCGTACGVSKAIVGLGIFETLFWAAGTFISWLTLSYFNTNGVLPGYDALHNKMGRTHTVDDFDPDKAAFSTAPADEEAYAPLGGGIHGHGHGHGHDDDDDEPEFNAGPYGGGGGRASSSSPHHDPYASHSTTSSYGGAAAHNEDTSYGGSGLGSVGSRYDMNTAYASQSYESHGPAPAIELGGPHAHLYSPPPADQHDEYGHPVTFPAGNYDNIGLRQV